MENRKRSTKVLSSLLIGLGLTGYMLMDCYLSKKETPKIKYKQQTENLRLKYIKTDSNSFYDFYDNNTDNITYTILMAD